MTPSFESTRVADDRVYQVVRQLSHPAGAMYSAAPEDPAHRDGDGHCGRSDDGTGIAQAECCCTCPLRPENAWRCLSNVGQDPVIYWRSFPGGKRSRRAIRATAGRATCSTVVDHSRSDPGCG